MKKPLSTVLEQLSYYLNWYFYQHNHCYFFQYKQYDYLFIIQQYIYFFNINAIYIFINIYVSISNIERKPNTYKNLKYL